MSGIVATSKSSALVPDWSVWSPRERGVLCFIIQNGKVLLIHKKRGLGAGKVNGPGGRIEKGESPLAAAIRETQEEVGVTPLHLVEAGDLRFQFVDGYSLRCYVFRADGYEGEFRETDEAKPFWCELGAVPFERMWADDVHWFHKMVVGEYFDGYFEFDGDRMLSKRIDTR